MTLPLALALGASLASEPQALPGTSEDPSVYTLQIDASVLADHLDRRRRRQRNGMAALTAQGGASILAGAIGLGLQPAPRWQRFHLANMAWGSVNLTIGAIGLASALQDTAAEGYADALRESVALRMAYGVNMGIDLGYIGFGAWTTERGHRVDDPTLIGVGRAVMAQGAFLLVFDAVMLLLHAKDAPALLPGPGPAGTAGASLHGRFGGKVARR